MSSLDVFNPSDLFIEIGLSSWRVDNGGETVEFPLERTEAGRAWLVAALREFVNKKGWNPRRRAFVAVGARGVSLRRMTLPPAPKDEFQRLLRLQIESEFPLPPDELAWGWQAVGEISGRQEVLVAAIKKELIEPAARILNECGISPRFTVAALNRGALCPPPVPTCAVLHIGAEESELLLFQDGAPASIRLLAWGANTEAPLPSGCLNSKLTGGQIYLTGVGALKPEVAARVAQCLGSASPCAVLEPGVAANQSAAIAGLKKSAAAGRGAGPLIIRIGDGRAESANGSAWKWAAAAALLLLALICFPLGEALVLKPHLTKKLAAIQADRTRLPAIDHELEFLQFLKRSQPPYLDTLYLISKVAPSGTSFDTVSMSRKGELSLHGKLAGAQQVTEFRSNLISSAWFSTVVVEEQSPTPDRQVSVRMTAQVKPIDARKPLVVDVPPAKAGKETNSTNEAKPAPALPTEPKPSRT